MLIVTESLAARGELVRVDFALGVGELDGDTDTIGPFAPAAGVNGVLPPDGVKLLAVAIRADDHEVGAVQDGDLWLLLFQGARSVQSGSEWESIGMEAASGFEPLNRGFADLCLSHLATPPKTR